MNDAEWDEAAKNTAQITVMRAKLHGCTCEPVVTLVRTAAEPDGALVDVWHADDCAYRGPLRRKGEAN